MEYGFPKEDNFYKWKGVAPPVRQSHGIKEDDIEEHLKRSNHKCQWKQRGNELVCTEAGEFDHGMRIPVGKMLSGTGPNGEPLLRDVIISA
jgi:hypothetical protein